MERNGKRKKNIWQGQKTDEGSNENRSRGMKQSEQLI